MNQRKFYARVGAALLATCSLQSIPAGAAGPPGFVPTPVVEGTFPDLDINADKSDKWDLKLKAKGATDVRVAEVNVLAGGSSGWHSHPGPSLITVTAGTVRDYDGSNPLCTWTTWTAGHTYIEPGGSHIHLVKNESGASAHFYAIGLFPTGSPTFIPRDKPTNCPNL